MIKRLLPLTLTVFLVSACTFYRINSDETTDNFYQSKKSASDVAYLEQVTQPHEVLGTITVSTERNQSQEEVILKMKREAATIGADAITDIQPMTKSKGTIMVKYQATAVAFKGANTSTPAEK